MKPMQIAMALLSAVMFFILAGVFMGVQLELNGTKLVVDTAHKYGKFAGTVTGMSTMKEYYDMGYDFLNCSADVVAINADCNAVLKAYAGAVEDIRPENG